MKEHLHFHSNINITTIYKCKWKRSVMPRVGKLALPLGISLPISHWCRTNVFALNAQVHSLVFMFMEDMHRNIQNSIIHDSPKPNRAQISINTKIHTLCYIHIMEYHAGMKIKKFQLPTWMNRSPKMRVHNWPKMRVHIIKSKNRQNFRGIWMSKLIKLQILNMYSAQYVNCAPVNLFKKQMALEAVTVVTLGRWG